MPKFIVVDRSDDAEIKEEKHSLSNSCIEDLSNFLLEFNMNLSIRLLNTLVRVEDPEQYLINYALLTGRDHMELAQKCQSFEFKKINAAIKNTNTDKEINKRFILYFGHAGTGKTTKAMSEAKTIVVMNENVTPKELLLDFSFEDGQPSFKKSALALAMEKGEKIVLDEINLAPFETIRFLQGILDNKEEVTVGHETFKIKEGFQIIGTMNEEVLGMESYLPEPLIDRAKEIVQFKLTTKRLKELAL